MVDYRRNMQSLMQTPAALPEDFRPDHAAVRSVIETALREKRRMLNEIEGKRILAAYGIPAVATEAVTNATEAIAAARRSKDTSPNFSPQFATRMPSSAWKKNKQKN